MDTALFFGLTVSAADFTARTAAGGLQDNGTFRHEFGRVWNAIGGGDGASTASDAGSARLTYYQSTDGFNVYRSPDDNVIAQALTLFDEPFRPGVIFGTGVAKDTGNFKLYYGISADSASSVSWNCADPAPTNPNEATSAVEVADDGNYYIGTFAGRVFQLANSGVQIGQFPCSQVRPSAATPLWGGPGPFSDPNNPAATGQVVGISRDVTQSETPPTLYVSSARFDQWRIARLAFNPSSGWVATPLAARFPHGITVSCLDCGTAFGTFVGPILADPYRPNRVYVGTNRGIYVGSPGSDGVFVWNQDQTFPQVFVDSLQTGRRIAAPRAASFGRGVWEQVFASSIITSPVRGGAALQVLVPPTQGSRHSTVEIGVEYDAKEKAYLHASAESDGVTLQHFVSHDIGVKRGKGHAVLLLTFEGAGGPSFVESEQIRVSMTNDEGDLIADAVNTQHIRWRRHFSRSVTIDASLQIGEGLQPHVPVLLSASTRSEALRTPSEIAVRKSDQLTLVAPRLTATSRGSAKFVAWSAFVVDAAGKRTPLAADPSNPRLSVTVDDDLDITARYELSVMPEKERRVLPARLHESYFNKSSGTDQECKSANSRTQPGEAE
jgi:hypothetical protein